MLFAGWIACNKPLQRFGGQLQFSLIKPPPGTIELLLRLRLRLSLRGRASHQHDNQGGSGHAKIRPAFVV